MEYSPLATALIIFSATYLIWIEVLVGAIAFFVSDSTTRKRLAKTALIIIPISYAIAFIASLFYDNPRPFVVGGFEPLASNSTDNGFPSDHTLIASMVAAVFLLHKRTLGIIFAFTAIIIGFGRVYAGVHHPIDIVGSLVIVSIVTALYWYITANLSQRN